MKKRDIHEYREKLDKTLSSPELTNEQTLKTLIRNQLHQECNEEILDQKSSDLSSILKKLRSVSTKDQDCNWKLKHDHEDCRVMYREGLEGSPFHTLLVEGYLDGPIQDCLCVSWESSLYEKWWPKTTFPAFRILQTKDLQKSKIDEQICLVRMKVPWPMRDREAIVQFFLFEYFQDGLIIILLNTITSSEEVAEAVRVDLVGGVAIQKVTPERSYLRYISEVDIKLDLVPPSLINFCSRQLLGNGFRLFNKTIGSVAKSDDYRRVLADPLYTRIRQALYSTDKEDETYQENVFHSFKGRDCEENDSKFEADETRHKGNESVLEIEEVECVDRKEEEEEDKSVSSSLEDEYNKDKTRFCISPEVKQALSTLERVISMVRKSSSSEKEEVSLSAKQHSERKTEIVSSSKVCTPEPKIEVLDEASLTRYLNNNSNRRIGSSSLAREGNKIVPASPEIDLTTESEVTRITISQVTTLFSQTAENSNDDKPAGLNGGKSSVLQRKRKPGCFGFRSRMRKT